MLVVPLPVALVVALLVALVDALVIGQRLYFALISFVDLVHGGCVLFYLWLLQDALLSYLSPSPLLTILELLIPQRPDLMQNIVLMPKAWNRPYM